MPCPRCGYENPSNARFCARCNFVLQADINAYHPDEQMKVVLPPVIRPLQPVFKARPVAAPAHQPAANSAPLNPAAADADQTVLLPPKAAAPRESEPGAGKRTSKRPAALAKQATHFSLAIGIASVLLLAMAVGYYLVQLRKEKPVELTLPPVTISAPLVVAVSEPAPVAASEPIAATSAPAEVLLPQSAVAEAAAPAPLVSASAPDQVTETTTEPVVAPLPSGPRVLAPREVAALLRSLRTRSSAPLDCQSATTMLINDYEVVPRQAGRIAKLAYPELCMPAKPAAAPAGPRMLPAPERAGNTASPATPPTQTRAKARTIDEAYEERIGSECSRGAFGHICRESIRLTLCSGKLSDNPPPGQTVCTQ